MPVLPPPVLASPLSLGQTTLARVFLFGWAPGGQRSQRGQATTEYALVLLGAAAIALLLVGWATRTGAFASLLDTVLDSIKKKV